MSIKLEINDNIYKNSDIFDSEIDNELVMMNIENNAYYNTSEVGKRIWQLLDEFNTVEDICNELVKEYDVSMDECQKNVLDFVNNLLENKLITKK